MTRRSSAPMTTSTNLRKSPPAILPSINPAPADVLAPSISAQPPASESDTTDVAFADDLASELQTQQEQQKPVAEHVRFPAIDRTVSNMGLQDPPKSLLTKQTYFAPYESALKSFKAYRYHPQYSQDVSGGFRSLTYSHQINAEKPLCKYEAAGGVCNDQQCQDQHFRSMQLSGASQATAWLIRASFSNISSYCFFSCHLPITFPPLLTLLCAG